MLSDEQQRTLLGQARQGVAAALEQLLQDFRGPALAAIHKTLRACGLDGAVHADEALQQASFKFIAVGLRAYRGVAAPRTYFTRIAINCALDVARQMSRVARQVHDGAEAGEVAPVAQQRLEADVERQALMECLEQLPPRYRRSVELFYLEQLGDCATCARVAGVSRAAFMQQLCRARALLARCVGRRLG